MYFQKILESFKTISGTIAKLGKKKRVGRQIGRKMTPLPVEAEMVHINSPVSPDEVRRRRGRKKRSAPPRRRRNAQRRRSVILLK